MIELKDMATNRTYLDNEDFLKFLGKTPLESAGTPSPAEEKDCQCQDHAPPDTGDVVDLKCPICESEDLSPYADFVSYII